MTFLNTFFNFVRKSRIFNKSRYSRNRQNVRVTFYFGVYFNILIIFLIYNAVYGMTFVFAYVWEFYFALLVTFVLSTYFRS